MLVCLGSRCLHSSLRMPVTSILQRGIEMAHENAGHQFLIVGLGNHDLPRTRHSVGMAALDTLAHHLDAQWAKDKSLLSMVSSAMVDSVKLILLKPRIPMNTNGKSIAKAVNKFHVAPSCIYLVHDDLDKALGRWSIKEGGSARGHNGVRSTMNSLQSDEMMRLRIGIDRPANQRNVTDYVLSAFSHDELPTVQQAIHGGLHGLLAHIDKRIPQEQCLTDIIPSTKPA